MKKVYFLLILLISLFLVSCITAPKPIDLGETLELKANIRNSERFISIVSRSSADFYDTYQGDYLPVLRGAFESFDVSDELVQSNDVVVYNDGEMSPQVITAYNFQHGQKGAIQILNFVTAETIEIIFEDANINAVNIDENGNVIFAGSTTKNGFNYTFINKFEIKNSISEYLINEIKNVRVVFRQPSLVKDEDGIVVTSLEAKNGFYYYSLANVDGKVFRINDDLRLTTSISHDIDYVKDLKIFENYLYALSLNSKEDNGYIYKIDLDDFVVVKSPIYIATTANDLAKASLVVEEINDNVFAAYSLEKNGFQVKNVSKDDYIYSDDTILVNGLSFNKDNNLLFVTFRNNVGSGIGFKVFEIKEKGLDLEVVELSKHNYSNGVEGNLFNDFDVEEESSSNYVVYDPESNLVFAAAGKAGLFMYEFVYQNEVIPNFGDYYFEKGFIKVNPPVDDEDRTPQLKLDFLIQYEGNNEISLTTFNFFSQDGISALFDTDPNIKKENIFNSSNTTDLTKISYEAIFTYLGVYLENEEEIYSNIPLIGHSDRITFAIDAAGNNGLGQILVNFKDYPDLKMVIRAYHPMYKNVNEFIIIEPMAEYELIFDVIPEDASIVVRQDGTILNPASNGTYYLEAGIYDYEITKSWYSPIIDFIRLEKNETLSKILEIIQVSPMNIEITATDVFIDQKLSDSDLAGIFKDPDTHEKVEGDLIWNFPDTGLNVTGSFEHGWTFTPENTERYEVLTGNVTLNVQKQTPIYDEITAEGVFKDQLLSVSVLEGTFKGIFGNVIAGTLAWINPDHVVIETGNYDWAFTPTDINKYNIIEGTARVSLKDKLNPVSDDVSATQIIQGQMLSDSTLTGIFKDPDTHELIDGTLVWINPDQIINNTGDYAWIFTPSNDNKYNVVEGNVLLNVIPKHTITFNVTPDSATIVLKQGENIIDPESNGTYSLVPGNYTYTVSLAGYDTATGSFEADGNKNISITLEKSKYDVNFNISPQEASDNSIITVRKDGQIVNSEDGNYKLISGNYTYTINSLGYLSKTGSFTVSNIPVEIDETLEEAWATVKGDIQDLSNGNDLTGVTIKVLLNGNILNTIQTDSNSSYEISLRAGRNYVLEYSKTAYVNTTYNLTVPNHHNIFIPTIRLARDSALGTASGKITNAFNAESISGATLELRLGGNNTDGDVIKSISTNSNGNYSTGNLAAGTYTALVSKEGFTTSSFRIDVIGGKDTNNQNYSITPIIQNEEIRIVLTWGRTPRDLDSHLTGPRADSSNKSFRIFWNNKTYRHQGTTYAELDVDIRNSYGPETITIKETINGTYRFSVHDYSNWATSWWWRDDSQLSKSGAVVDVYKGNVKVESFNVPTNQRGLLWVVFEIDGETQEITPINEIIRNSTENDFFPNSFTNLYDFNTYENVLEMLKEPLDE